jgi:hypothetical protein
MGLVRDASDVDASSLELDGEEHEVAGEAMHCADLDGKEVGRWSLRRSGAGAIPASANMRLTVLRPSS